MILTDPTRPWSSTPRETPGVIEAGAPRSTWSMADAGAKADIGTQCDWAPPSPKARPVQIHGGGTFLYGGAAMDLCCGFRFTIRATGSCSAWSTFRGPASTFNPQSLALAVAVGHHVESISRAIDQAGSRKSCCTIFLTKKIAGGSAREYIVLDRRGAVLQRQRGGRSAAAP